MPIDTSIVEILASNINNHLWSTIWLNLGDCLGAECRDKSYNLGDNLVVFIGNTGELLSIG